MQGTYFEKLVNLENFFVQATFIKSKNFLIESTFITSEHRGIAFLMFLSKVLSKVRFRISTIGRD
jgi:hypothetical protein